MFPFYNHEGDTRPLGLQMCQNRLAVPTWSYAMEVHPPKRIVELGTYSGGLTIALGLHAHLIDCKITSYEQSAAPMERYRDLGKYLGITFRDQVDLWTCEKEIEVLIKNPGITYVLCDGGDKPRELAAFAKYLKPGDVIAAHDYNFMFGFADDPRNMAWEWHEVTAEHGKQVADDNNLEPFYQEHFDFAGWLAYRKR